MAGTPLTNHFGDLDDASISEEDLIKVLIATDIHLGYEESTQRKQIEDSFITFEEILQTAVEQNVDMILLGGDLFHDTKPSQNALHRCVQLIRKYCLGQKEIKMQFLSNPEVVFSHCNPQGVNFEDANINVKIPIFTVNGNHDDPTNGIIGSMDVISATGLVNYFGKCTDVNFVRIPPLVFRKGQTTMALHGLSHMNEQRLSRLFRDEKVKFYEIQNTPGLENCFDIFVLHQNRVQRGTTVHISEHSFPDFLNLVIWGHEHECMIDPIPVIDKNYYVCQPGSTVATSLCQGEVEDKHIALLQICNSKYKLTKIKLQTVRPFVFEDLYLIEQDLPTDKTRKEAVFKFICNFIENDMMAAAARKITGHPKQPILPLLRLRIYYDSPDDVCDSLSLSRIFSSEVANPRDILMWKKLRPAMKKEKKYLEFDKDDDDVWSGNIDLEAEWHVTVQDRLNTYFNLEQNKNKLKVLTLKGLNAALTDFVENDNIQAFSSITEHKEKKVAKYISKFNITKPEEIQEKILEYRNLHREKEDSTQVLKQQLVEGRQTRETNLETIEVASDDDESVAAATSSRGRGRGKTAGKARASSTGKGSRGGRGSGRGAKVPREDISDENDIIDIDMDNEEQDEGSKTKTGKGRGRPKGSSSKSRSRATSH